MDLILVGLNHVTTPIELREKLAFSDAEVGVFLNGLAGNPHVPESLLLSTCNRTELYGRMHTMNGSTGLDPRVYFRDLLTRGKAENIDPSYFYMLTGIDAIRHLFRVSAGLDSMIMGESQILGQVKDSYNLACKHRTNGFYINRVSHAAFRVGRRARSETEIGVGAVSISMAAVELSQKIFRDLAKKRALVVGAGEMATLTAEHFISKKIGRLVFTNRTMEKAEALAQRFGGTTVPWDSMAKAIAEADIVITSTRSPVHLINAEIARAAMHIRRNKPVFMIDIAVPRNIDPAVGKLYNVFAHNIDDLKQIVDKNLARRRAELPKVEKIIEEELDIFLEWYRTLSVTPTIKALMKRAEDIRTAEVERSKSHFSQEQQQKLDAITRSIVNKLLHSPVSKLKESGDDEESSLYRVETVRDIFDLDIADEKEQDNNRDA